MIIRRPHALLALLAAGLTACMTPPKTANDMLAEGPLDPSPAMKRLTAKVTGPQRHLAEGPLSEAGVVVVVDDSADLHLEATASGTTKTEQRARTLGVESFIGTAVVRVSDGRRLLGQSDVTLTSQRALHTVMGGRQEGAHETDEETLQRAMRAALKKALRSPQVTAYAEKKAPPSGAVATPPPPAAPAARAAKASIPTLVAGSPQPNAWAIVVGVETYKGMPQPTGARADAERFSAVAQKALGVPATHVHTLLDGDATKGALERELAWAEASAKPGSRIYFFFSGHGSPDTANGAPYILPADADAKFVTASALSLKDVLGRLSTTKAKDVFVFVDACYSGSGGRSVLPPGARPLVRLREEKATAQIALFSASSGAEISGPSADASGGLFTNVLVSGLATGAADLDGDGSVSLQELADFVRPRVAREAQKDHRDQNPSLTVGAGLGEPSGVLVSWGLPPK